MARGSPCRLEQHSRSCPERTGAFADARRHGDRFLQGIMLGVGVVPSFGVAYNVARAAFDGLVSERAQSAITTVVNADEPAYLSLLSHRILAVTAGPLTEEIRYREMFLRGYSVVISAMDEFGQDSLASRAARHPMAIRVINGAIFGAVHATNNHDQALFQATGCAVAAGILLDVYAEQGLVGAWGTHFFNNAFAAL